MNNWKKW